MSIIDALLKFCGFPQAVETRDEQWNVGQNPRDPYPYAQEIGAIAQYNAAYVAQHPAAAVTVNDMAQRNHERYEKAYQHHKMMRDMTLPEDETERLKAIVARLETNMKALRDENEKLADEASKAMDAEQRARAELAAVRATLQSWHRKRVTRTMQAEIRKLTERLGG
jgi:predicted RNase H-like nuclease (RuvC/YqgF family)